MTLAEENYLKAIFFLEEDPEHHGASTNAIAACLDTRAASVSDMLRKLAAKDLISYQKYRGAQLTELGRTHALAVIRRHRLWETFLVEKLGFGWEEVHEVAEELEHIKSDRLIDAIDRFLDFPKFDPHGDFIPDAKGRWTALHTQSLARCEPGTRGVIAGVRDSSREFLETLDRRQIALGSQIEVLEREAFDGSLRLLIDGRETAISQKVAEGIYVQTT